MTFQILRRSVLLIYTMYCILVHLKGHGNEADFLGFLQKLVPHESLTLPFGLFRFWLRIRGDIRIRKTTPRYHRYGESPTPRIVESGSRRLPASLIRGVGDSPYHRYGELATPHIGDSGESFFEYEYLRKFEAKIGTARRVV
jgi:hypothetical protein